MSGYLDRVVIGGVTALCLGGLVLAASELGVGWAPVILVAVFGLGLAALAVAVAGGRRRPRWRPGGRSAVGGTVVDVKEEADRLVLEVLGDAREERGRLRFEVPRDWDVNFGDRVRLQGRYLLWSPADGDREFPLPLLAFSHAAAEPEGEGPGARSG